MEGQNIINKVCELKKVPGICLFFREKKYVLNCLVWFRDFKQKTFVQNTFGQKRIERALKSFLDQ